MLEGDCLAVWLLLLNHLICIGVQSDANRISKEHTKTRLECAKYATECFIGLNLQPHVNSNRISRSLDKIGDGNDIIEIAYGDYSILTAGCDIVVIRRKCD